MVVGACRSAIFPGAFMTGMSFDDSAAARASPRSNACIQISFWLPTITLIAGAVYLILGIWVAVLTAVILCCVLLAFLMSMNASAGKSLR